MKQRFSACDHCENAIAMIRSCKAAMRCRSERMQEITPYTGDGAEQKHIPVSDVKDETVAVSVGENTAYGRHNELRKGKILCQ